MSSNINPPLIPTSKIADFRFWCQKVLPLVYDDSLSYYEVLGKMVVKINEMVDTVNNDADNVITLKDAFLALQTYVNEFFDDIDQLASYAERAEAAQTAANTSAVNAATSASNASASSLAAMNARDAAVAARQAAQASANTASTAATNANTKANEAAQSAITAQTAQASASQNATLADSARSAAQTAASTATTKANEANASASNAETSANNAAQSKTETEELVNEVQENLDNIQKNTLDISKLIEFYPSAILPLSKYATGANSATKMNNEVLETIKGISGAFNLTGGTISRYNGIAQFPDEAFNITLSANTRIKIKIEVLEIEENEGSSWFYYVQIASRLTGAIQATRTLVNLEDIAGTVRETYYTITESTDYCLYVYLTSSIVPSKVRITLEAVPATANNANMTTAMLLENM